MRMWWLGLALAGLASVELAASTVRADCVPDSVTAEDLDGDGVLDAAECGAGACPDRDMDGLSDRRDPDDDGDGLLTCEERPGNIDLDTDGDGTPNYRESDDDGDGVATADERPGGIDRDSDGDGIPDALDADDDGDGILTRNERPSNRERDTDKDGIPDYLDTDDDGDGVDTVDEGDASRDSDNDNIPDYLDNAENSNPDADAGAGSGGGGSAGTGGTGSGSGGSSSGGTSASDTNSGLAGGGLCTVGAGNELGKAWALLALCLGVLCWRRRSLVLTLLLLGLTGPAWAQVPIDTYTASPLPRDGFQVPRPETPGHLKWSALLLVDYAKDPLLFRRNLDKKNSELGAVIGTSVVGHAAFGLGLGERAALYISVPVSLVMSGDADTKAVAPPADGAGLMDVAVGGRAILYGEAQDPFAIAGELVLHTPTAKLADDGQVYRGESYGSVEPSLVVEGRLGRSSLGARAGGRFRKPSDVLNVRAEQELRLAAALRVRVIDGLEAQLEVLGSTPFSAVLDAERSPFEALLGARGYAGDLHWGVAAGPGLSHGYGTPQVRALALVGYAPGTARRVVNKKEPLEPTRSATADADHDGLVDRDDACVNEPEDKDGFDDGDGCPDSDNDQDGVADKLDKCQGELEDTDDFQDEDGCLDPDNDSDEILDELDTCPDVAEDKDGLADGDGCAEDDADSDNVPDKDDACPSDPGIPDALGCPLVME